MGERVSFAIITAVAVWSWTWLAHVILGTPDVAFVLAIAAALPPFASFIQNRVKGRSLNPESRL